MSQQRACIPPHGRSPSESPDCGVIPGDPTTSTSSFESVEQFAAPECTSPTATMDPVPPAACSPASPVSYPDLCGNHRIWIGWRVSNRAYTAKKKLMLQRLSSRPPVLFPVVVNMLLNKARRWLSFLGMDWQALGYQLPILVLWIIGWWFFRLWPNHTRWSSVTFQSQLT